MISEHDQGLWAASLPAPLITPPLGGEITVDLAIVGGGFTGCAAALAAARGGASVALLEAQDIGYGGSGRNVGLVNAGLWLPPDKIAKRMGAAPAHRLMHALSDGPAQVFATIRREGIKCEALQAGTLHLAHSPAGLRALESRLQQSNASGQSLQLLNAQETAVRTGSPAFYGALLNPAAGTIQPLAYCQGLARAAIGAGASVYANSPVQHMARTAGGWRLQAPGGTVQARALLLATNAYPAGAAAPQAQTFTPVQYCQFATAPLPAALRRTILPGGEGCWDTAAVMSSVRRDAAGRIIIGGMGSGHGVHARWARRKLREIYPQLSEMPFAHHWAGRIAMTHDKIPKALRIGPDGLAVFGFSGRGIAPGTVLGASAARYLLGIDSADEFPLPITGQHREVFPQIKAMGLELAARMVHAVAARRRGNTD